MVSADLYAEAVRTAYQHPEYTREMTPEAMRLSWLAAALTKRLECEGGVLFSWLRWVGVPDFPPVEEQWRSEDGDLWLADVVAAPNMSGIKVGKALRRGLVERGIATEGERVYFFRQHTQRFGSFIARGDA